MVYVIIFLCLLLLLCGAFTEVGILLAVAGGICILFVAYVGVRSIISPEYEERIKREAEEARKKKYAKKKYRKYPTERMFRDYYRTGDRNYLWNEDYRK